MPQYNWWHPALIHDLLHDSCVGSKGPSVQSWNIDSDSMPAQAVRQPVKVRRLMPQPMNEYYLSLLAHPHSLGMHSLNPDHPNSPDAVFGFHRPVRDKSVLSVKGLRARVRIGDPKGSRPSAVNYCIEECRTHP